MRKKTILLLLPLFAISCNNIELDDVKQEEKELLGKTELEFSKAPILVHSCDIPECELSNNTSDTILVLNGEGDYRIVPEREYILYYCITGEEVRAKTLDVLDMRVNQDTIFLEYLRPDIHVRSIPFWVYDKENNRGKFYVSDPGIIGGL